MTFAMKRAKSWTILAAGKVRSYYHKNLKGLLPETLGFPSSRTLPIVKCYTTFFLYQWRQPRIS